MFKDWHFGKKELNWPLDENGEREKAVLLTHTLDEKAEAELLISMLAAYEIPAFPYYDKEGATGRVISGFSGFGADIYVPQSMLEDAKSIMQAQPVDEEESQ